MTRRRFGGPRRLPFLMALALAACSSPTDSRQISDAAQSGLYSPPGTVVVTPKTAAIAPGATIQLTATVTGLSASTVTWTSSNTAVATVSSTGLVTGVSSGNATIVAKSTVDPDKRAAASIAVRTPPIEISVTPKTAALLPGATQQLTATVTGASNTAVTWSSSNPAVATVSSTGLVTAVAAGNASIIATSQANTERRGGASITVRPLPAIEIKVSPERVAMVTGRTAQLSAVVRNTSNTGVTWSSSNPAVATVSSTGLVTGVTAGTAMIIATSVADADKRGGAGVTVRQ
ncbi:MAG: Ig-like domain-containing protein [Longimicrobiales bacterium]